jgi:chromosome segregation ATPase
MKNCKVCNNEFNPKHETRGHEQLYCSVKCRAEAYKKRVNEKQQTIQEPTKQLNENIGNMERQNDSLLQLRSDNYTYVLSLLEKLSDAKTEAIRYQLKCEQLEKENEELKIKSKNLEMELSEIEESDEDENDNDIISGLMTNFKKDPVSTINFATSLFSQYFKQNVNAKATTTT